MRIGRPTTGRRMSRAWVAGILLPGLLLAVPRADRAAAAAPREVVALDAGWRFHRGDLPGAATLEGAGAVPPRSDSPISPAYDDRSWRRVDVPHDYIVEGTFNPKADPSHGFLPVEPAWYRKTIDIPASARGRRLWLEFDGVYRNSRTWLNGRYLGNHPSGYTSFRYDITAAARPGKENLLAVRVDPTAFEGWWYEGGGIYRHVRLVSVDPVHIAPWGVFVKSEVPHPDGPRADAMISIGTALANESASAVQATLLSEVVDAGGAVVARSRDEQRLRGHGTTEAVQTLKLSRARLWSVESPWLYTLRSTLLVGGKAVDQVTTPFGVRTIHFDPDKGFFLNGKPVKIQGTSNHQDHAGVGIAVPDRLQEWRIATLKAMGCNGYRCAHNPVAAELLDACDRLGMLVMDENRHLGATYAPKATPKTPIGDLADLSAMVLRDRNHPSVIMWSICNEEGIQGSPAGGRIARAMKERINQLDGTRPVTAAMNGGHGSPGGISGVVDLEGFNYSPGEYGPYHRAHPRKPLFASETASAVGTRGIYALEKFGGRYFGDPAHGYVAAYDLNAPPWAQTAEAAWRPIAADAFMAGCFAWTGFDYKGEPTPFRWPCINSHFGILDICGFPKDAWWYYRSWWTDQPVLHIFPHWNWAGCEGREVEVWCYSNCRTVELFRNGTSLGRRQMKPNGHLAWKVKYQPGVLLARGERDGKQYTARVETTGNPAAVVLEPDRHDLKADGSDVSLLTVKIVDAQGRIVPVASNAVSFTVAGPGKVIGVGNGDPSSHEPDKASKRAAFQGLCLAIVQTTRSPGAITVMATAAGLRPATVTLRAK